MKKLIKLLFPKAYQAIISEGYNQAYNDYNSIYDDYDSDYDYSYEDREREEMEQLQQLHDEHYLHEEYYAELAEEYENECRKAEEFLAEIYNPKAPLLSVGDKIHLHSKQGMYTVAEVYNNSFAYCTQYSELSYANYNDYKCHAGGKWNYKGN